MATYKEIKGVTVQTLDSDPVVNAGSWASANSMNTGRLGGVGAGQSPAAIMAGGYVGPPGGTTATETWNGTSWTEVNDLNTAFFYSQGFGTTSAMVLAGRDGPGSPSKPAATETWNGSSWSAPGANINTNRFFGGSAGTSTAGIVFGGQSPTVRANTESWNGSAWTEVNDLNTAKSNIGNGTGTYTAAISAGGDPHTTESWDGTNWTEITDNNTQRRVSAKAGTSTDALMFGGLNPSPANSAKTESWNGTAWTEVGDLAAATSYNNPAGSGYASTPGGALNFGGQNPSITAVTEEWSFPPDTAAILTEGQIFLSGGTKLKGFGKAAGIPAATWASGGSLNTARRGQRAAGSISAGLCFGGPGESQGKLNESYNGTSWTEVGDMNSIKNNGAGFGTQASAIATNEANVETWNGSAWTETTEVNTDRTSYAGATGPTSAGIVFGGYTSTYVANVETWNGSVWTEVNDLNNARSTAGGAGVSSGDAICILGDSNPYSNAYVETWDGTNWTEITQANTGRYYNGASGASSSAITYGGYTTTAQNNTEVWNGSTWTEINNLATARFTGGSGNVGSTAASAFYAGGGFPDKTNMEEFSADNALATITVS